MYRNEYVQLDRELAPPSEFSGFSSQGKGLF